MSYHFTTAPTLPQSQGQKQGAMVLPIPPTHPDSSLRTNMTPVLRVTARQPLPTTLPPADAGRCIRLDSKHAPLPLLPPTPQRGGRTTRHHFVSRGGSVITARRARTMAVAGMDIGIGIVISRKGHDTYHLIFAHVLLLLVGRGQK